MAIGSDNRKNTIKAADEAAIRDLFDALLDDWERGDGEAYGCRFTGDADYVAFDGSHTKGSTDIAASHQQLFDKFLKGTRLVGRIASVKFLGSDVALVHATGGTVMRGKTKPSPERDSIQTLVAVKREGEWRFAAFHNSRVRPISGGVSFLIWALTDLLWRLSHPAGRQQTREVGELKGRRQKRFKIVPEMEGAVARWYAQTRRSGDQIERCKRQASQLTNGLPVGVDVLEVAPGPGYLAIEMARLGRFHVTGLDISRSFVEIANENARRSAVSIDFRRGDVASMPFDEESFDLIVCQAAFKNFAYPVTALNEMHRVLRGGGTAVIQDMRRDASFAAIDQEVKGMELGRLNAFATKCALAMLRRRAHSRDQFTRLVAESAFRTCDVRTEGIGMEVRLKKQCPA